MLYNLNRKLEMFAFQQEFYTWWRLFHIQTQELE
jgi:hypothetical protein